MTTARSIPTSVASAPVDSSPGEEAIPYPEYLLRILFTSFYPAVRLAVDSNYPLDSVKDMMTLALWQEAKRKHTTINLISLIFGKSTRTVKALSARFNKGGFFAETETNLMRRIEDLLRQRPMTLDELSERLPHCHEFDGARLAVNALVRERRIVALRGPNNKTRYEVVARHQDLVVGAQWEARIDALAEHLEAVSETIRRRFLSDEPEAAVARTFTFKARPEDMAEFREALLAFIREKYPELEARALDAADARVYAVYAGVTPKDVEEVEG